MKNKKSHARRTIRASRLPLVLMASVSGICAAQAAPATDTTQASTDSTAAAMQPQTFRDLFMDQVVDGSKISGRVGVYDFRRWHDTNQPYAGQAPTDDQFNTEGTNYGAQIGLTTGRIYGFSAGAQFVYESSFYGNNADGTKLNLNLAGDGPVENLTQGFLQYNNYGFQIRGGRQLLNTPLAGADQFTFLPRSFNGVSAVFRPLDTMHMMEDRSAPASGPQTSGPQITRAPIGPNTNYETDQYLPFDMTAAPMDTPEWQIFGAKIDRYEGRGNADGFHTNNRYFTDTAGFWSAGTTFLDVTSKGQLIGQYYHYRFQETESADYGEVGYMAPTIGSGAAAWAPYVRAQVVAAYDGDQNRIPEGIDSQIYGLKLGINTAELGFAVFGNFSPINTGSFNDGQMLHPYTDLSGVNYTDTMNDGIDEFGPGWAAGARFDFTPTDNLSAYARYVQYEAKRGHYHDFYFNGGADNVINDDSFTGAEVNHQKSDAIGVGVTYDMGGLYPSLAGLKINDNLGITRFYDTPDAPNFFDNRVRFYYEF